MDFGSSSGAGGQKLSEQELMAQVLLDTCTCRCARFCPAHAFRTTHPQVQQQLAIANLQQFMETVQKKCFERCITKPGTSISSSEQQCITRCCDRYSEALEVVTKSLFG